MFLLNSFYEQTSTVLQLLQVASLSCQHAVKSLLQLFALDPGATMNEPWKLKSDLARSLLSVSDPIISDKDFNALYIGPL